MAEKKRGRKNNEDYESLRDKTEDKPSKDEFNVAKWIKKNVPIKKTKLLNHNVEYFTGKRAVDALVESQFAKGDASLFKTREEITDYLHLMLQHKLFHRARKVAVSEAELKAKKKKSPDDEDKKKKRIESEDDAEKRKKEKEKGTDAESSVVESKSEQGVEREKKKKKIRLIMHNDQRFLDNLDAYVWIYDPVPFHYWIMGTLLVLATIGMCLFPLWPPSIRTGVYYLSLTGIGFFVSIIVCVILRAILFCLIWMCTLGRHHLWILPNLTEEVGFLESFWPLYHYEYRGDDYVPKSKKDKKKKKDKDSDAEEEEESAKVVSKTEEVAVDQQKKVDSKCVEGGSVVEEETGQVSDSSESQRSSTGRDFEMVDQEDL